MKTTSSPLIRRMLISAGFVIGFGVLAVGTANADEDHSSGLLGGLSQVVAPVADQLAPVTSGVGRAVSPVAERLAPVVSGVTAVAEPVLEPVTTAVRPLTEQLRPVVDQLAPTANGVVGVVAPVLEPLRPVTGPLLVQVTDQALPVATPVVQPLTEPLVRQAGASVVPVVPVELPPSTVLVSTGHAWEVPSTGVPAVTTPAAHAAPASPWYQGGSPAVPRDVPLVVQGTTTSASAGGLNAPTSADVPGSPRTTPDEGGATALADGPARGSWFYDYGLHHPS
jgi:hypothetical protein